jgi:hypothetical protein
MIENGIYFGILDAPASNVNKLSANTNDVFYWWLLTERGASERWAREIAHRRENPPEDARLHGPLKTILMIRLTNPPWGSEGGDKR